MWANSYYLADDYKMACNFSDATGGRANGTTSLDPPRFSSDADIVRLTNVCVININIIII